MKILHIISSDGGGISSFIKNIVSENKNLHKHTVLSFGEYGSKFRELESLNLVNLVNMPRPKIVGMRKFLSFINQFLKDNKFDLIESHIQGIHAIPFKFYVQKNKNGKFAIHSHQTDFVYGREKNFKEKLIYKLNPTINNSLANVKIACGEKAADYAFASAKDVYIIRNSVDVGKFISGEKKNKNPNKIKLAHIGRHTAQKNLGFLLALMEDLRGTNTRYEVELYCFGEGELTEIFQAEIAKKSLSDCIYVEGRKDDIYNYMKAMDIVLLPSYSEGLPTVAIEAQAAQLPIIISDTVTREVDLKLGLAKYLAIEPKTEAVELWKEAIFYYKKHQEELTFSQGELLVHLNQEGFTTEVMFTNYLRMLNSVFEK